MKLDIPVIGILRGVEASFFGDVMGASFAAGLQAIEVTMNTPGAEHIISTFRSRIPEGKYLGAGTVRNLEEAKRASDAGAMFFVTPNLDLEVIAHGRSLDIPVISGALTPTEIYTAWSAGASMVKVFPCGALGGPSYIRDVLGPFDGVALAAVGGVTRQNLRAYFEAGARAVGVSTSLFGKEALAGRDLEALSRHVREFVETCNHISSQLEG
jgi:2-dehydro-3-deoxyphosphogluconate aldolase / (4S)-4-hydroxy-2-oxoglutarate aldolase